MRFRGREVRLGDPKTADIVIFDETNSAPVRRALNSRYSIAVFKVRPEELRIGFAVALNFVRSLGHFHPREAASHRRGFIVGAAKQLLCIYYEACLAAMRPKAVVTFIDNSDRFGWLSRHSPRFPYIAIQNGVRLGYGVTPDAGYYLQHLFSWGYREPAEFPGLGYRVEHFHPVGSLLASLHWERGKPEEAKRDILIVSAWRGNIGYQQDVVDQMRSMEKMDRLLAKYVELREVRAAVILRAERDGQHWMIPEIGKTEEEYFRAIFGDRVGIVESDFSKRNVYPEMKQSTLIVSCLSSAALEAFGYGKKILYCNFTGTDQYHAGLAPEILTEDSHFDAFAARLDDLLAQPEPEYNERMGELRRYYMSYPEHEPTYSVIADEIDRIIAEFRTSER